MTDLYDILGVMRTATETEIRSAYLKKARETHPDTGKEGASAEAFSRVQQAYEVLMDGESRKYYDQYGKIKNQSDEDMLMTIINNAFGHVIMSGVAVKHTDLRQQILDYFQEKIHELEDTIRQFKSQSSRMKEALERFKFEEENPLEKIVLNQEGNVSSSLAQLQQGLELYQRAHEIFFTSEYSFEFKPPEPRSPMAEWTIWDIPRS